MPMTPSVPYRTLLLASAAAFAMAGQATSQTISTPVTAPVMVTAGTPLVVTGSGSIVPSSPADGVSVGVASPSLSNSGLIQTSGAFYSVHVTSGGNLGLLTNSGTINQTGGNPAVRVDAGGVIGAITNVSGGVIGNSANDTGIFVSGQVNTITNSGTIGSTSVTTGAGISLQSTGTIGSVVNNSGGQILTGAFGFAAVGLYGPVGSFTNMAGGTIVSSGTYGAGVFLSGTANVVTNAGLMQANGSYGVGIGISAATVGTVTNSGTLQANGANGVGIAVNSAMVTSVANSGLIQANGSYGVGIDIGNYAGIRKFFSIPNGVGARSGVGANYVAIGTLTNSGTILANGSYGIGIRVQGATVTSLMNTGLIQANGTYGNGIVITYGFSRLVARPNGNIASGRIGAPIYGSVGVLTNAGTIQANSPVGSGYLQTRGIGIKVLGGSVTMLNNLGLIQANGTYGSGIAVGGGTYSSPTVGVHTGVLTGQRAGYAYPSSIATLTNSGIIQANGVYGAAISVGTRGAVGTVINNGTIISSDPTGIGIIVYGNGTLNRIVNNAGGIIQGGSAAIANFAGYAPLAIVNAGQIIGNVFFGRTPDSLTITGAGTVAGNIIGYTGAGNSVTFNTSVPYTLNNTIQNVDSIAVQGGTVTIQQFGTVTTPIVNALSFNIAPAGTVRFNSGTIQAANFVNNGLLNIGTGTPTINAGVIPTARPASVENQPPSGQFIQTSTGQFGVGVMSTTTNGLLTVNGAATVGGSVIVATPTVASQALTLLGQTFTVLTASNGLTAPVVGSTAASSTTNPAVIFTVGQSGNNLTLTAKVNPVTNLLPGGQPYNLLEADIGFATLANSLLAKNDIADYGKLIAPFVGGIFTTQQQITIMTKLEASLVGANIVSTNSVLSLEGAATQALLNHQTAMRQADGMAAGDEVGRGYHVWIQPFGSFQTQNSTIGFYATDASTANSYGAVMGGDTLVRPDLRVGLALTLGNTDISYSGNLAGNKASVLTTQLALYATWYQGRWFVDGSAGFGLDWFNTHESELVYGGSRDAGFHGTHLSARIGTGYDWQVGSQLTITPYAAVQDTHYDISGYTTHGLGLLDLTVANKAFDTLETRIGAKAAYTFTRGANTYTPEVHFYYLHNFGSNEALTTSESFVGGGSNFFTRGPTRDRDVYNVGFGLTVAKIGRVTVTGLYDYFGGATSSDHQVSARLSTDF